MGREVQPLHSRHCDIGWRLRAYSVVEYLGVCGGIHLPGFCGCVLGVLFVLGNVVSNVHGVGGMYMWLCGSVSGSIVCGFVLAVQIGLMCIIVLNPSLREWGICSVFGAACIVVSSGPGKLWVQVGSSRLVAAALGLGVFLFDACVANGLYSL